MVMRVGREGLGRRGLWDIRKRSESMLSGHPFRPIGQVEEGKGRSECTCECVNVCTFCILNRPVTLKWGRRGWGKGGGVVML